MADQTQHAPGSWKAYYHEPGNDVQHGLAGWAISTPDEGVAYNVAREANARLIAAAPELLLAWDDFDRLADTLREGRCTEEEAARYLLDIHHKHRAGIANARTAIAKAEGK